MAVDSLGQESGQLQLHADRFHITSNMAELTAIFEYDGEEFERKRIIF